MEDRIPNGFSITKREYLAQSLNGSSSDAHWVLKLCCVHSHEVIRLANLRPLVDKDIISQIQHQFHEGLRPPRGSICRQFEPTLYVLEGSNL